MAGVLTQSGSIGPESLSQGSAVAGVLTQSGSIGPERLSQGSGPERLSQGSAAPGFLTQSQPLHWKCSHDSGPALAGCQGPPPLGQGDRGRACSACRTGMRQGLFGMSHGKAQLLEC